MAQKTFPQFDPLVDPLDDNSLFLIDTGIKTFKATGAQLKQYTTGQVQDLISDFVLPSFESLYAKNLFQVTDSFDRVTRFAFNKNLSQIAAVRRGAPNNRIIGKSSFPGFQAASFAAGGPNSSARAWNDIVFAEALNMFVVVGNQQTNDQSIATAADGIWGTWILRNAIVTENLNGVTWSPQLSLLIAVGDGGKILKSPNGISWTEVTSGTSDQLISVTWSPELNLFVAVGDSSPYVVLTSSDGDNWSPSNFPGISSTTDRSVKWLKDKFYITTEAENGFCVSEDGSNWTRETVNAGWGSLAFTDITYFDELDLFFLMTNGPNGSYGPIVTNDFVNYEYIAVSDQILASIDYLKDLKGFMIGGSESNSIILESLKI